MARRAIFRPVRTAMASLKGQGTVEFALVIPIFLFIVCGIVDLGRAVIANNVVSNASREGARAAIYPGTTDAAIATAINGQSAFLGNLPVAATDPGNGNYVVVGANTWNDTTKTYTSHPVSTSPSTERTSGSQIMVTVNYRFIPITPVISSVVGNWINLSAKSTMMIE